MKKAFFISAIFILLALVSGCANFGQYMKDRGNDFADCFGLEFSLGLGLTANVRVTQAIQAGAGVEFVVGEIGFLGREFHYHQTSGSEAGLPLFYFRGYITGAIGKPEQVVKKRIIWSQPYDEHGKCTLADFNAEYDRHFFGIGFTVHAIILGINAEFNPVEFADFLLGWTTLDISDDDYKTISHSQYEISNEERKKLFKDRWSPTEEQKQKQIDDLIKAEKVLEELEKNREK